MTALALQTLLLLAAATSGYYSATTRHPLWLILLAVIVSSYAISGALHIVHIRRFFDWLKNASHQPAPLLNGAWSEAAYQVEKALRAREQKSTSAQEQLQKFLLALQASPNGVLLLDAHDRIDWCNATAADHFGLNPDIDLHQNIGNLVRNPEFIGSLQSHRNTPVVMTRKDGRGKLSVQCFAYGAGCHLLLTTDITAVERAERMRRDFVANVSHEIRTPLTVLSGFIETLQTLPLSADESSRYLGLMGQQAQRLQSLVNDLLILARLEDSPRPPLEWFDMAPVMQQLQQEAEALSGGRHTLAFVSSACQWAGVERELHSAMSNLISNAIRYTPAGGRIEVHLELLPDGRSKFAVSDTGLGIAQEHLSRLTERFYRVDNSRSRETGGTGLGLSIVKHVVMRHGGDLHINSEEGKGSRFSFTVPAARTRAN